MRCTSTTPPSRAGTPSSAMARKPSCCAATTRPLRGSLSSSWRSTRPRWSYSGSSRLPGVTGASPRRRSSMTPAWRTASAPWKATRCPGCRSLTTAAGCWTSGYPSATARACRCTGRSRLRCGKRRTRSAPESWTATPSRRCVPARGFSRSERGSSRRGRCTPSSSGAAGSTTSLASWRRRRRTSTCSSPSSAPASRRTRGRATTR
mmetsp:Transcript_3184/g.9106  ORF Transcript_3184/g.9106 Transcript_3184/m.9106 type:complete len:206 (-) Transcript_3184:1437-2054(-)